LEDELSKFLKKIDGKKVSFDKAFKIMEKIIKIMNLKKKKPKQLEMKID
jgi:hypothetical protein